MITLRTGHSSRISQFADSVLQANPDRIFIQSTGNEGDEPWRYSNFLADIRGGVDFIKPDVCAYVQPPRQGTSYTAPVIAGLYASLLKYHKLHASLQLAAL